MDANEIAVRLPEIYQRCATAGTPLRAALEAMEAMHAPVERVLADLDARFDPARTTAPFRAMLARWVDLACVFPPGPGEPWTHPPLVPEENLRGLVEAAWYLARWRGTARGLEAALRLATGEADIHVRDRPPDGDRKGAPSRETAWPPFHLEVHVPASVRILGDVIERIVRSEKPAHATHRVLFHEPTAPETTSRDSAP